MTPQLAGKQAAELVHCIVGACAALSPCALCTPFPAQRLATNLFPSSVLGFHCSGRSSTCLLHFAVVSSAVLQGLQENQGLIQGNVVPLLKNLLAELSSLQSRKQLGQDQVIVVAHILPTAIFEADNLQATQMDFPFSLAAHTLTVSRVYHTPYPGLTYHIAPRSPRKLGSFLSAKIEKW